MAKKAISAQEGRDAMDVAVDSLDEAQLDGVGQLLAKYATKHALWVFKSGTMEDRTALTRTFISALAKAGDSDEASAKRRAAAQETMSKILAMPEED